MGMNWFQRNVDGEFNEVKLFHLHFALEQSRTNPDYKKTAGEGEWVCGYQLPPFQRGSVWKIEDNMRFIDSARQCINIGEFTVNQTFGRPPAKRLRADGTDWYLGDMWLLDGQQRLRALQGFWDNEYPVHGFYWKDLDKDQRRQFLYTVKFPFWETAFTDEETAAAYYDLRNFSGVRHAEADRARPVK